MADSGEVDMPETARTLELLANTPENLLAKMETPTPRISRDWEEEDETD